MKEDCKYYNSIYFVYILKLLSGLSHPGSCFSCKVTYIPRHMYHTVIMVLDMITKIKVTVVCKGDLFTSHNKI